MNLRDFMKIIRGDCGHIKARWDNHHKHRTYAARKSVMTRKRQNKKRKRLAVNSDLSTYLMIGAPPYRAILPGVGPIMVPAYWMLSTPKACPPGNCHQSPVNQALASQSPVNQLLVSHSPVNQAPSSFSPANQAPVNQSLVTGHPIKGH